jgi:hypothetical protein
VTVPISLTLISAELPTFSLTASVMTTGLVT